MFCSQCGKQLPNEAKFCDNCGTALQPSGENVPVLPIKPNPFAEPGPQPSVTHINIGVPNVGINVGNVEVSPKSKIGAFLLALFFGGLGFHNFYMGHSAIGAIQLILQILIWVLSIPTLGLSFIVEIPFFLWVFIEMIMILCGSVKDGDGLPIRL